jgi:antitoxin component YwqK of YwqJK toxin-antitoxin module
MRLKFLFFLTFFAAHHLHASKDPNRNKNGTVKVYYSGTKQLKYSGTNKNYRKEGVWTYYSLKGQITHTEEYRDDILNGTRKVYDGNLVIAEENYTQNILQGIQIYRNPDGKTTWKFWFTTGMPDSSLHFADDGFTPLVRTTYSGRKITSVKRYCNNGSLRQTEYYENGLKTGTWITYSITEPGTAVKIVNYRNGMREGLYTEIRETGERIEIMYRNDLKDGDEKTYINGTLAYEAQYLQGKLHGHSRAYRDKQVVFNAEYVNGRPSGVTSIYQPLSGMLISRKYWSNQSDRFGLPLPDSTFEYSWSGKLIRSERYMTKIINGKSECTGSVKTWHENGKPAGLYATVGGEKNGAEWQYYPNGNKQTLVVWSYGKPEGPIMVWYENGQIKLDAFMQYGELSGQPTVYSGKGQKLPPGTDEYKNIVAEAFPYELLFPQKVIREDDWQDLLTQPGVEEPVTEMVTFNGPQGVYDDVNISEIFPGGISAFVSFVKEQAVYPGCDNFFGHKGLVLLSLTLAADGSVKDVHILFDETKGIALSGEALRLVRTAPWQNSLGKETTINLPLRFGKTN